MAPRAVALSLWQRLSYGVGHVLNDLAASMWFSYLLVYLQFVLEVPANVAGMVLLTGQIVDAVATPLVGLSSDSECHSNCCPVRWSYGKRKTWHLIGTILVCVSFPFIFAGLELNTSLTTLLALLIPLVIVFQIGWAATQISHLALIPELTPVEAERDELNIIRFAFDLVSDMTVYVVAWFVLSHHNVSAQNGVIPPINLPRNSSTNSLPENVHLIDPTDAINFRTIVSIITTVGIVFSIIFHFGTPEAASNSLEAVRLEKSFHGSMEWKDWFQERHFYVVGVIYMCARLFHNLSNVYMPLYLQEGLHAHQEMLAIIPLIMQIAGFIGSLGLKIANASMGKKSAYIFASVVGGAGCAWLYFGSEASMLEGHEVYGVAALLGFSGSVTVVLAMSFTADLIAVNTECGAFVYGCMSFCDKLTSGVAVALIQVIHGTLCSDGCTWYYRDIMAIGIAIPLVVGCIAVLPLYSSVLGRRNSKSIFEEKCPITPAEADTVP